MIEKDIAEIIGDSDCVKWDPTYAAGVPGTGWFLLEISPISSLEHVLELVADIHYNREIRVENGSIYHLEHCQATHKLPSTLRILEKVMRSIEKRSFSVALHPGLEGLLFGQPLAISLNPRINYEIFPDHPHLNTGGSIDYRGNRFFLADSFCYQTDIAELYPVPVERYRYAFAYITDWLFRHMIWEESRKYLPKGIWIGPQEGELQPRDYIEVLNPAGPCRCRSGKSYGECHLANDLNDEKNAVESRKLPFLEAHMRLKFQTASQWRTIRKDPQDDFYADMQRKLLR